MVRFANFGNNDGLAVGGKIVGFGGGLDDCFGSAAVHGNALEKMIVGGVHVVQPLAVIRTGRHPVVDTEGELLQVCAVRVDAPKICFGPTGPADGTKDNVVSFSTRGDLIHDHFRIGENHAVSAGWVHDAKVGPLDNENLRVSSPVRTPKRQIRIQIQGSETIERSRWSYLDLDFPLALVCRDGLPVRG